MNVSPKRRQLIFFSALFLMGANLLIGCSYRAKQDSWISVILSVVFLCLWMLVLGRISTIAPGKNVFELLWDFPQLIRIPLVGLLVFYCFSQAAVIVRVYSGFAQTVSLQNTDLLFISLLICLSVLFFARREDGVLYRFSYVSFLPIIFIVILIFLLLTPKFRSELLFPIFYDNEKAVLLCALENLSFPFGNAFLLLGIENASAPGTLGRKVFLPAALLAGGLTMIMVFQDLLLLGGNLASVLDYPYNFSTALVNVADFFSRLEVFASLFFFLSAIVRSAYFMKMVSRGIHSFSKRAPNPEPTVLVALLWGYSLFAFQNTGAIFRYLEFFPYFALPLQFGFPLIIWIKAEIEFRRERSAYSKMI